eukprot:352587-Chlamydomonas_euryale.AAC.8
MTNLHAQTQPSCHARTKQDDVAAGQQQRVWGTGAAGRQGPGGSWSAPLAVPPHPCAQPDTPRNGPPTNTTTTTATTTHQPPFHRIARAAPARRPAARGAPPTGHSMWSLWISNSHGPMSDLVFLKRPCGQMAARSYLHTLGSS